MKKTGLKTNFKENSMIKILAWTLYIISGITGFALIIPNPVLGTGYLLISWGTIYILSKLHRSLS